MRLLIVLLVIAFTGQTCIVKKSPTTFTEPTDETIKREIASFSKCSLSAKDESLYRIKLEEIPIRRCTDSSVYFSNSRSANLFKHTTVNVWIYAGYDGKQLKIKTIDFIHEKYQFFLPDSAIANVFAPKFCKEYTKEGRPLISSCKVFRSEDEKRVYIHMLNSESPNRSEVIWVVQNSKYYNRFIDVCE